MPKISREAAEERRAQIIAAAMRCFSEKGLSRVTLRDVFREAEMSAGAVYNYFQSKDEIILAVTRAGMTEALTALEAQGEAGAASLDQVLSYFFGLLEDLHGSEVPRIDVMIVAEALSNPDVHQAVTRNRTAVRAALIRLIREKQAVDESWVGHSAAVLADLLYATYQGLVMSLSLGEEIDIAGIGEALREMRFT